MAENEPVVEPQMDGTVAAPTSLVESAVLPSPPNTVDWIGLAMSLREPEIEILQLVYRPEPSTRPFLDIYHRLERLGYSERTARRKIAFLAKQRLVVRVYSVLGFVGPASHCQTQVQALLRFLERRRQGLSTGCGITAELVALFADESNEEGSQ